ncbi:MAG: GNAT family N-acetyltransferase [Lachnospiraceae bacterium]|nr:GNAT family N-acetyltransferase [Lachnospiraceae bacterium]
MRREIINKDNVQLYIDMIPSDLEDLLFQKNVHAFGAVFAETPVGAVIWADTEGDTYGRLLSLFVVPEARRLGVGTYLLETVASDMVDAGKEGIAFKYNESGDRRFLTLFFNIVGFETDTSDVPVGRVTFGDAARALKDLPGIETEAGIPVSHLAGKEKAVLHNWISRMSPENASIYMRTKPDSFAVIDDGEVKGALLFRKEDEETISLDYAYSSNPRSLIGMLSLALKTIAPECTKDTRLEMLLATDAGRGLYEKLFGPTEYFMRIAECRQNFQSY